MKVAFSHDLSYTGTFILHGDIYPTLFSSLRSPLAPAASVALVRSLEPGCLQERPMLARWTRKRLVRLQYASTPT